MAEDGRLQNYSVDQAAGAVVLVLGAVGGLLLVIWQSACHCKINCCYLFQCERRPPSQEKMKSLAGQLQAKKDAKDAKAADAAQAEQDKLVPTPTPTPQATPRQEINLDDRV
jgi:hypothetical protein